MVSFSKSHYSSSASSVSASSFNVKKLHKQVIYVKNSSCSSIEQSGTTSGSMAVSPGGSAGGSTSSMTMMTTTRTSSTRMASTDRPLESAASITTIGTTDASTTSSSPVTVSVENGLGASTDGSSGSLADLERNVLRINEWMPDSWQFPLEPVAKESVIALWFRICIYSYYLLYSA